MSFRSSLLFTLLAFSLTVVADDSERLNRDLRIAASIDDDEAIARLLDAGADVNAANQFGKTALMNAVENGNILTTSMLLARGADHYRALGSGRSRGTLPLQLAGNVLCGGLVELPFGISLREVVETFGAGTRSGRPLRAIQVGGPPGAYLPESRWDTPLDYESFAAIGAMLGHGGVVLFDDTVDMAAQARFAMEFCAIESCGKCAPCRVGSTRGVEVIDRIIAGDAPVESRALLRDLCDTLEQGSLCAMGGLTPMPVRSALDGFPGDFD